MQIHPLVYPRYARDRHPLGHRIAVQSRVLMARTLAETALLEAAAASAQLDGGTCRCRCAGHTVRRCPFVGVVHSHTKQTRRGRVLLARL